MKIIATFDRSKYSEAIVPVLQKIAVLPEARIILLSVAETPAGRRRRGTTHRPTIVATGGDVFVINRSPQAFIETKSQAIAAQVSALEDYLTRIARQLPERSSCAIEAHVGERPAEVIIKRARQEAPVLIVMATHGHTGLVPGLFGSVLGDVVRSGVAPVLIVHPKAKKQQRISC